MSEGKEEDCSPLLKEVDLNAPKKRSIRDYFTSKDETEAKRSRVEKENPGTAGCDDEYEVETILDYAFCKLEGKGKYLVKWVGWSDEHNTWEPYANLDCQEKLKEFYYHRLKERESATPAMKRNLEVPPDPRTHFEKRSQFLDSFFSPPCFSELNRYFIHVRKGKIKPAKEWTEKYLETVIECVTQNPNSKPTAKKLSALKEQLMLKHLRDTRKSQKLRLKEWEDEINKLESVKIKVENEADLEGPPRHMTYIMGYLPFGDIVIPDDPPYGCECTSCELKNDAECCPSNNGHFFPYTKFSKLRLGLGNPIYECNKRCKCDSSCANRVVQKGRKIKLCIFRTYDDCGWGVKTLEHIKQGSFIVDYAGQVITSEEAEERGKQYDAEGRTYLFDLDFNLGDDCPYTVDAAHYGNAAHFINHSCDPNLAIFNVWVDCLDPNLPRLCLFAQRDIVRGEQLTFDYCQSTTGETSSDPKPQEPKANRAECKCGTLKCRKWLFER